MDFNVFLSKVVRKATNLLAFFIFQYPRIIKYRVISDCKHVTGCPKIYQPVMICGKGKVVFGKKVTIGVMQSPSYHDNYTYIDVRKDFSEIRFGNNVWINNSCSFISEGEGIDIGGGTLMGINCEIIDSDFHELGPKKRMGGTPQTAKVIVGRNVFLGSNVKIMKGVIIGDNSVIANSSVVTKSIPANVIAGGNPAKVLRPL